MLGDSLRRRHGSGRPPEHEGPEETPEKGTDSPPTRPRPGGRNRPRSGIHGFWWRPWWHWLLAGLVLLGGSFLVGFLLSTQLLFPRPETAGTGIAVPTLYGETREEAESAIAAAGLTLGAITEMSSLQTERGRVLAQDPLPGQELRAGGAVSLGVSVGSPELRVPPLRGMDMESATRLLEEAGFEVAVQRVDGGEPEGRVLGSQPASGDARALPAVVTLQVAAGPPSEPASDSVSGPGR